MRGSIQTKFGILESLRDWCGTAKPGDEIGISIVAHVDDEQLLAFIRDMNQTGEKHIWIEKAGARLIGSTTETTLRLRCSH
jgi:hypothetical protein